MADISYEISQIREAVYGEEVRGSIINALLKINGNPIDADDLGLYQDKATGYVFPTYKGVRSKNGIPLSGGGGDVDYTYLNYYSFDGLSILYKEVVPIGGNGVWDGEPEREPSGAYSYEFIGWAKNPNASSVDSDARSNVTEERNVYAVYRAITRSCNLRYYDSDGGELLYTEDVAYGNSGTYDGQPEKESDAQYIYTFAGWSKSPNSATPDSDAVSTLTEDRNVYAVYSRETRKYTLTYYDYDGVKLLNTEQVEYNQNGTYSRVPMRDATAQYYYTFVGWSYDMDSTTADSNATKNVTSDRTVYAAYSRETRTYILYYYTYDRSSLLYMEGVAYGRNGTYTDQPSRDSDAQHDYTFVGWSRTQNATTADPDAIKNITSDRSVYAAYSVSEKSFNLRYYTYDGGTLLNTDTVAYGGNGTYTGTPTREADAQYTYTFVGWSTTKNATTADSNATKNITAVKDVYAAYGAEPIPTVTHTLNYYDYDGSNLLHSETVAEGEDGTWDTTPAKESTTDYPWIFKGWALNSQAYAADELATKNITSDRNVYAAFDKDQYQVTFARKDEDGGGVLQSIYVAKTDDPLFYAASAIPTTERTDASGYEFVGFTNLPSTMNEVHNDLVGYADFRQEIQDDWTAIAANISNGIDAYNIGDYKIVDLGDYGTISFSIVGKNSDELISGNGYAAYTWMALSGLSTAMRMNVTYNSSTYGTGAWGGYPETELYDTITTNIASSFPSELLSIIKPVKKYTSIYNTNKSQTVIDSAESIWIPSQREIRLSNAIEKNGPLYDLMNNVMRPRYVDANVYDYWLRSTHGNIQYFTSLGITRQDGVYKISSTNNMPTNTKQIIIGFCT